MPQLPDREKRRIVVCRSEQALQRWENGRPRKQACDPITQTPPVFYIPEEGPVVRFDLEIPDGILLSSKEITALCDNPDEELTSFIVVNPGSGAIGDYTVRSGEYQSTIEYSEIPNITEAQLYHISTLDQEDINQKLSDGDFSPIELMRLNNGQRQFLINEVTNSLNTLRTVSEQVATAMLSCVFSSDAQTHCCPNGTFVFDGGEPRSCFEFSEGYKFSPVSKESANLRVVEEAQALLADCVVGNDEYTIYCNKEDNPQSNNNAFGSSFVAANTFFERSKEEANNKALDLAEENLVCLYCNDRVTIECGTGRVLYPEDDVPCNPGQCVDVLSRFEICRETSDELDAAVATAIANADECSFFNKEHKCNCNQEFPDAGYDYTEEEGNFNHNVIIPEGTIEAPTQEIADFLAREQCLSELVCGFCSNELYTCQQQGLIGTNPRIKTELFSYEEAIAVIDAIRIKADVNGMLPEHPDSSLRGETPPSPPRYTHTRRTLETYRPGNTDILAFTVEMQRRLNAGIPLTESQRHAINSPEKVWTRPMMNKSGEFVSEKGGPPPDIPFCDTVSFVSKEAAFEDLINKLAANSNSGTPNKNNPCASSCPEGFTCKPEKETNPAQKRQRGAICNVTKERNGEASISYCVPEGGGGGGGGGGGKDRPCPAGSSCMTLADAIRRFGKNGYEVVRKRPCDIIPANPNALPGEPNFKPIEKFCIKPKKANPPGPGGGGGGNFPPDQPDTSGCPSGCFCVESPGIWEVENPELTLIDCSSSGMIECSLGDNFSPGNCFRSEKKDVLNCPTGCTCIHDFNYFEYAERYNIFDCPSDVITFHCAGENTRSSCYRLEEKPENGTCSPECECGVLSELQAMNPDKEVLPCGSSRCTRPGDTAESPIKYCYFLQDKPYPEPGTGSLIWEDCDGFSTTLLEWVDGLIVTNGPVTFVAGCSGTETPTDTPP